MCSARPSESYLELPETKENRKKLWTIGQYSKESDAREFYVQLHETKENRNYVPVDFISIELFFGEERAGQLDLAWSEKYLLRKDRLAQFLKREIAKEQSKH